MLGLTMQEDASGQVTQPMPDATAKQAELPPEQGEIVAETLSEPTPESVGPQSEAMPKPTSENVEIESEAGKEPAMETVPQAEASAGTEPTAGTREPEEESTAKQAEQTLEPTQQETKPAPPLAPDRKPPCRRKYFLAGGIVLVVLAGVAVLFWALLGRDTSRLHRKAVIYQKEGQVYISSESNDIVPLRIEQESIVCVSRDGESVYYTAPALDGSATYDLYLFTVRKGTPELLINGIQNRLEIKESGALAYYYRTDAKTNATGLWVYQKSTDKHTLVAENVEKLLLPDDGEDMYYIQTVEGLPTLFYWMPQKEAQQVAQNAMDVQLYQAAQHTCQLLFTTPQEEAEGNTLYLVSAGQTPVLIAEDVGEVRYDLYAPGNNLYYYGVAEQSQEETNWQSLITDTHAATDAALQEPKSSDYFSFFGFSPQYDRAMAEYREKDQERQARDRVRAALDAATQGKALLPKGEALYVYAGGKSQRMLAAVNPDTLYCLSPVGTPRAIVQEVSVSALNLDVADLVDQVTAQEEKKISAEISAILQTAVQKTGLQLISLQDGKMQQHALEGYDAEKTTFQFSSSGNNIFAVVGKVQTGETDVFCTQITEHVPGTRQTVDNDVTQIEFVEDAIWYLRPEPGRVDGGLYRWEAGVQEKIAAMVYHFTGFAGGEVLIYNRFDDSQTTVRCDLQLYVDGELQLVDESVALEHVQALAVNGIAYLKNVSETTGGDLYLYSAGKAKLLDINVSQIVVF